VILADVGLAPGAPGMPPPKFFIGGGVLINSRHIVSAAHLGTNIETMEDFGAADLTVLVGKHDMNKPDPAEMMFEVESVIKHPDFDFDIHRSNDIMILRLRQQVNLNIFTPVCLPPPSVTTSTQFAGEKATVAGFGATFWPENHDDQPILPDTLQELDEVWTVVSSEECVSWVEKQIELGKNFSSEWLLPLQEENMFCATSPEGMSTCFGDSGSPLMHQVAPRVFELLGLVSWGDNCRATERPTVFSNVPHLHDWIVSEAGAIFYHNVSV